MTRTAHWIEFDVTENMGRGMLRCRVHCADAEHCSATHPADRPNCVVLRTADDEGWDSVIEEFLSLDPGRTIRIGAFPVEVGWHGTPGEEEMELTVPEGPGDTTPKE